MLNKNVSDKNRKLILSHMRYKWDVYALIVYRQLLWVMMFDCEKTPKKDKTFFFPILTFQNSPETFAGALIFYLISIT